jgi:hypothetical protein
MSGGELLGFAGVLIAMYVVIRIMKALHRVIELFFLLLAALFSGGVVAAAGLGIVYVAIQARDAGMLPDVPFEVGAVLAAGAALYVGWYVGAKLLYGAHLKQEDV